MEYHQVQKVYVWLQHNLNTGRVAENEGHTHGDTFYRICRREGFLLLLSSQLTRGDATTHYVYLVVQG